MNSFIETLNVWGNHVASFAWPMLWQSSLLIVALFVMDLALRRRVRAAVRHALWLVVLLKLLLPPSLALPTSLAWWLPASPQPPQKPAVTKSYVVTYGNSVQTGPLPVIQHTEPEPAKLSRAAWLLVGWAFGGVGLFGFLLIRWRQMMLEIRETEPAPDWANRLLVEVQSQLNWRRSCRLRLTGRSMSPAVCGFVRPTILLPRALTEKLQPAQLRAVLLHELIHLRRGDVWVNCAQALLQIFYWWHPLLWFANARIRRVREEAVDDAVMLTLRDDAESYAPTLLEVAKLAFSRPLASLGLVGILESRNALRQRIERLVNFRAPRCAGLTLTSGLGIVAFAAVAAPMNKAPESATVPASISASASERLLSVTLKVDPAVFIRNVKARAAEVLRSSSEDYTEILLDILRGEGVDCTPPRGINFNTQTGEITTQNTPENLRVFQEVINELNLPGGQRIRLPHDRKTVLIEAQFYKMRPAEFDQLNLDRPASARQQNAAPWLLSPEKLGELRQRLKSLGLQPLSAPRIQTAHGVAASLFVGDKTNSISLECLPFIGDDGIEIATVARTTGMFNSNPDGDWPTSDGRTNCAVSARVPIESNGGAVLRAENISGPTANNLVIVLDAKLFSGLKPPPLERGGNDSRTPAERATEVATLTKDGWLLYEVGKLDKAEAKLYQAIRIEPENKVALLYLERIKEARSVPPGASTNNGRRAIVSKLDSIRLESVYYDGLPLSEVIRNLSDEARKRDPEKRGVNFIINPNVGSAAVPVASATIDPATGLPVGAPATEAVDLKSVAIKIVPAATDVRLADVLDMIVKSANKPIKYAIEDYGVVFLLASTNSPEPLYTRTFKVDANAFYAALRDQAGLHEPVDAAQMGQAFRTLFSTIGVDLQPPKNMFYGDRKGMLLVRATLADLDAIELVIQTVNVAPPQVNIKVTFVEMPEESVRLFYTELFSTNPPTVFSRTSSITNPQFQKMLQSLKRQKGVDIVTGPEVTTLSGRQAQIQVVDMKTIVNGLNTTVTNGATNFVFQTQQVPFGPALDVIPYVSADGFTIQMTVIPTVTEFLGYDDPREFKTNYVNNPAQNALLPLPRFRVRQIVTSAIVWDGQTVVLGNFSDLMIVRKPDGTTESKPFADGKKKQLFVFITPRIIDPAGNPVHTDEDMPFASKGVPPQKK